VLDRTTAALGDLGLIVVVAAGNDDADACNTSPARSSGVITVGATDQTDSRASYSNYGTCVNIFAPGSNIRSTSNQCDTCTVVYSGTSMATPMVSGLMALWLEYDSSLIQSDMFAIIAKNSTPDAISNVMTGSPNLLAYSPFNEGYDANNVDDSSTNVFSSNAIEITIGIVVALALVGAYWLYQRRNKARRDQPFLEDEVYVTADVNIPRRAAANIQQERGVDGAYERMA